MIVTTAVPTVVDAWGGGTSSVRQWLWVHHIKRCASVRLVDSLQCSQVMPCALTTVTMAHSLVEGREVCC